MKLKFKVGDKVKAVSASCGWGDVIAGNIGVVTKAEKSMLGRGVEYYYEVDFPNHKEWRARESDLELFEASLEQVKTKKKKGERIAELENKVETLEEHSKSLREELTEALKRIEELENNSPKVILDNSSDTLVETESEAEATEIIEFEGRAYKKVKRLAQVGDVVVFNKNTSIVCKNNTPYLVDNEEEGKVTFVSEIGTFNVYHSQYYRTPETVEVYELVEETLSQKTDDNTIEYNGKKYIKTNRDSKTGDVIVFNKNYTDTTKGKIYEVLNDDYYVDDVNMRMYVCGWDSKPTVYELVEETQSQTEEPSNSKRKNIIKKAKRFVNDFKDYDGDYTVNGASCTPEWIFDKPSRTIKVLLKGYNSGELYATGVAKCNPSDIYNEHIGMAIALGRALKIDVSEFENAVQPDDFVIGMVVNGSYTETNAYYSVNKEFILTERKGDSSFYYKNGNGDWIIKEDIGKILDDTNAKY